MTSKSLSLGIDIGGTFIKYGLVDKKHKIVKNDQIKTDQTSKKIIDQLINLILKNKNQINKVGLGFPGLVDKRAGKVIETTNLPIKNLDVVKLLKNKTGFSVKIDNDANCFALAEAKIGQGKNYKNFIAITLGTGIGAGIIINKSLYYGRGNAGEIGCQLIDHQNPKKLEYLLSPEFLKITVNDYQNLYQQALLKNISALKFWENYGRVLALGIFNTIKYLDPEIIILGGKKAKTYKYFLPELKKVVQKHLKIQLPKIVKSRLIDQGGIIGATLLNK